MAEETNKPSGLISSRDLGDGKMEATFALDYSQLNNYFDSLQNKGRNIPDDFQIGKGSVMNRYDAPQYKYLYTSNDTPYTQALKTPTDPHKKIELAVELYHKEPIIGTAIDLMADFSSSGYTNECDDKEIKKLFDKWAEEVGISELLENIFLEYYRSGNVTIYRSDKTAKVTKSTKSKGKNTSTEEYDFPAGYTILNPMNVLVEGSLLFNQEIIKLRLNEEIIKLVTDTGTPQSTISSLPEDFVKTIRAGGTSVTLDADYVTRITRKRQPYERYATPYIERVFEPILYKQKLRMMDMSTIEGLINQLVTVTVGDKDFPAGEKDLEAIAELFQTPNKAYTIFWNHTLKVTFHKPEGIDTLKDDKYKQVNDDILAGLGISRVLLDGQGANFSTAWVSILSLIERLENARAKVNSWLVGEYKRIAKENNLKTYPKPRFNRMNLREDTYIRDVLLAMYDRGLIDEEDILVETGRDYESIIEMKKRNEKHKELFLPPEQPFQGEGKEAGGGRPTGSGGNYSKRKTAPVQNKGNKPKPKTSKATASYNSLVEEYESELEHYYSLIEAEVSEIISENDDEDSDVIRAIIAGVIIGMFKTLSISGDNLISSAYDSEVVNYHTGFSRENQRVKTELSNWNNSYVNKLVADIRNEIMSSDGEIREVVSHAFQSNRYRVSTMAQSGVVESLRQAKIQGNTLAGKQQAVWRSALADNTCNTCRGLNGTQYNIADIPPRPHANCQCDLDFI